MADGVREQIMNGLLAQLQSACGSTFQTYSRKFITWQDLCQMITTGSGDPRQLPRSPALFLYDGVGFGGGRDNWSQQGSRGQPSKRTLYRTIVIYAWRPGGLTPSGPSADTGAISLHPLVEAVEAALDPEPNVPGFDAAVGQITLNGLVTYAWIEGDGHCIPGDIDPSGLAMQTIPLKILIP